MATTSKKTATKKAVAKKSAAKTGRQDTSNKTKLEVWIRAAGHCELCGKDLTLEFVSLRNLYEGEVAHIFPAAPGGPRGGKAYTAVDAARLTNDPGNLMLLCPNCHKDIDKSPDGAYPAEDLTDRHQGHLERIKVAAMTPHNDFGAAVIVLGKHFSTQNCIEPSELQRAMFAEGIRPHRVPKQVVLPDVIDGKRDAHYYQAVTGQLRRAIDQEFSVARSDMGDGALIAIAGAADIPSLMVAGTVLGDRRRRAVFSIDRETRLRWPDLKAARPQYAATLPPCGEGPVALVLNISATIPPSDVRDAAPGARIATFAAPTPSFHHIQNRGFIAAFREQLQVFLSDLETRTKEPILVFAAIPAAFAIEFGALQTMNHQHGYRIYDRAGKPNAFVYQLDLNDELKESAA